VKALSALLSVVLLFLVGSCGSDASGPSAKPSEGITTLDEFTLYSDLSIRVFCRHGDKYYVSDVYAGWDIEVFPGHKDCEGK